MHIRVITPITTSGFTAASDFEPLARADTIVSHFELDVGPASIESAFDEALALPDTIAKIVQAEQEGADAVVVDCFGDPGVDAGREATEMLVLGPAQTSMHLAALLGQKFSVVTVLEAVVPDARGSRDEVRPRRQTLLDPHRRHPGARARPARAARACAGGRGCESRRGGRRPRDRLRLHRHAGLCRRTAGRPRRARLSRGSR